MDRRVTRERSFWDRFAPKYDRFMDRFAGVYERLLPRIRHHLKPTDHVLDVAAGTGIIALGVQAHVRRVTAVDISEPMLRVAQEKARSTGVENLTFHVADAYSLPFRDQRFDACIVANALHVMEHPATVLREIRRVLSPAGRLIAPTYCHGENLPSQAVSRLMGLFGFRACTRFSVDSFSGFLQEHGFRIEDASVFHGTPPLSVVVAAACNPTRSNPSSSSGA